MAIKRTPPARKHAVKSRTKKSLGNTGSASSQRERPRGYRDAQSGSHHNESVRRCRLGIACARSPSDIARRSTERQHA
jgi:hypothetical protein